MPNNVKGDVFTKGKLLKKVVAVVLAPAFAGGVLLTEYNGALPGDHAVTAEAVSGTVSSNADALSESHSAEKVSFTKNSMTLGGAVSLNIYLYYGDIPEDNYADTYVEFDVNGKKQRADFDPCSMDSTGKDYRFNCRLNAVSMADEVKATFHYIDKNGNAQTLTTIADAESYLKKFDESDAPKVWNLIRAINDYGYYMQFYLSYYAGEPWQLGVDHKAMQSAYTRPSYYVNKKADYISQLSAYQSSESYNRDIERVRKALILDSDTVLYLGIEPKKNYKGSIGITVDGRPAEVSVRSDGVYEVYIRGIPAHKLGDTYTVEITTDNGKKTVKASALSYAYTAVQDPVSDSELYAMCALYDYYKAALAYRK